MPPITTEGAEGAETKTDGYVDWDELDRLFKQLPSGPWDASRHGDGHEIRQIDTDPTNKHHWPFRLCQSISGQRAACDDAVFDFLAGVLNAWPQVFAERSDEAEIQRILAMPEDELRKRFLASGESPEQAATINRLCFEAASLRVALTRISEQYTKHRGDMTDAEALRAIQGITADALSSPRADGAEAVTRTFKPGDLVRRTYEAPYLGDVYPAFSKTAFIQEVNGEYFSFGPGHARIHQSLFSLVTPAPAAQGGGWRPISTAPTDHPVVARMRSRFLPGGWFVATVTLPEPDDESRFEGCSTILNYNGQPLLTRFHGSWTDWLDPAAPAHAGQGAVETPLYAAVPASPDFASSRAEGMEHTPESARTGQEGVAQLIRLLAAASDSLRDNPPDGLVEGNLYVAAKNEGPDSGWRHLPVGLTVGDLDKARAMIASARPAAPAPDAQGDGIERVRHVKRGTEYEVLHRGVGLQVALDRLLPNGREWAKALIEGDRLVIYQGGGKLYAREESEFDDGRFVPAAPAHTGQGEA